MSDRRINFLKQKAIKEKLLTAEKKISVLRLLVIVFNSSVFFSIYKGHTTYPILAYSVIAVALIYALTTIIFKPYLKYPLFVTSYFTSISDAVLISLWLIATGGFASPYYVLWYVSVVAIAFRYSAGATIFTALLYSLLYVTIGLWGAEAIPVADIVIRVGYIFLAGLIGGVFAQDSLANLQDKLKIRDSERALLRAQQFLELKVEERTKELATANKLLVREIQVRSEVEAEQRRLLAELKKSNSDLESFAYIVSHDLKAPLRAVSSVSEWLYDDLKEQVNEESRDRLLIIKNRVKRLKELIDGILRFSRVGRVPEEREQLDTQDAIVEVLEMLKVPENIKVEVQPGMPTILFERTLFMQVIQNLISNSIKYMDKENGVIRIGGKENGSHVEFYVADNGPGIEEKYHEKIFQIFQTLKAKDEFESTGVGLTIVKKIVETSGGKIWLNSELDKGACFHFTIKKKAEEQSSAA